MLRLQAAAVRAGPYRADPTGHVRLVAYQDRGQPLFKRCFVSLLYNFRKHAL